MKSTVGFSAILLALLLSLPASPAFSYAVLSHEAVIDASWAEYLEPLLRQKYPAATEDELWEAHAYLYGGAVMPDIGYAPFGSKFFTCLVHYVRTGDFVMALLEEAQDLNEYAFALGFLSHYFGDVYGHPLATNEAVAIYFPKLKKKYGSKVTYEECHNAHLRTEFGFDVLKSAKGNYASKEYHDFIGFQISESVLERAFLKTYGMELGDVFTSVPASVSTFRFSVRNLIPALTKVAWITRKNAVTELSPLTDDEDYIYKMDKRDYKKEFGKPGLKSVCFAAVITVLPKIGPLSAFRFKTPGPEVQKVFNESFDTVLTEYHKALKKLRTENIQLENRNWDTGKPTNLGEYELADETYCMLIFKLKKNDFTHVNGPLKEAFLAFYNSPDEAIAPKPGSGKWKKMLEVIQRLKNFIPSR